MTPPRDCRSFIRRGGAPPGAAVVLVFGIWGGAPSTLLGKVSFVKKEEKMVE